MKLTPLLLALALACGHASDARALDLVEACRGALLNAPEAALARAARDAGAARRSQALALWRPNVQLEAAASLANQSTGTRGARFAAPGLAPSTDVAFDTSVNGGTATRYALAVRQPVYGRERAARSESLEIAAEAAELEWAQAQQTLMIRTVEAYFSAALAAERLRVLQRQAHAVDQAAAEARDRFRIGDLPVTDVHEATARAAALEAERMAAETRLQSLRVNLSDLTGLSGDDVPLPLPTEGAWPSVEDVGALPDWLTRADRQNPWLRWTASQVASQESRARATEAEFSPTVDVVAQLGHDRISGHGDFGDASQTSRVATIGVQIAVPLYTGGMRSAQATEQRALVARAQAELQRARQQVAQQARSAWLDLAVGRSQEAALVASLRATRARLDATRVGREVGDRTTLDLLNAENDTASAEMALLEARAHLIATQLRLAALAGEFDDAALQKANARLHAHSP